MTCMEVAGMKRVLFKILLPALLIAFWMDVAYYPSLKDGQLDYFTYWIIAGLPFGIKAIGGIFYPVGFDLQGGIAVLAMNVVLGGLVGGFVLKSDNGNCGPGCQLTPAAKLNERCLGTVRRI